MIRLLLRALRPRRRYRLTPRQQWYRQTYLQSPYWRHYRSAWWQTHPNAACARCGRRNRPMDLHHLTYRRLGHEQPGDVVPLHRACHQAVHHRKARR